MALQTDELSTATSTSADARYSRQSFSSRKIPIEILSSVVRHKFFCTIPSLCHHLAVHADNAECNQIQSHVGRYRWNSIHVSMGNFDLNLNRIELMDPFDKLTQTVSLRQTSHDCDVLFRLVQSPSNYGALISDHSVRIMNHFPPRFLWFIGVFCREQIRTQSFSSSQFDVNKSLTLEIIVCFSARVTNARWSSVLKRETWNLACHSSWSSPFCSTELTVSNSWREFLSRWSIKRIDHVCFIWSTWITTWFSWFCCILSLTGWL